jgi:serine/threonine-protein kinase HSL1 (negative regulator of Swe1 kinase)
LPYSNSDYHHAATSSPTARDLLQLPTNKHNRSPSGYSILNNEHLYSRHSFFEPPPSDVSYDPFRASREPIVPNQAVQPNVTIHRGPSSPGRKLRPATALGSHTGSSLRIPALRNSKQQSSIMSRHSSKRSNPSQRSHLSQRSHRSCSQRSLTVKGRSISRSSMTSSHWPNSPPVIVRPGGIGRRGVSFSHLRRASVSSSSTAEAKRVRYTPEQQKILNHGISGALSARSITRSPPQSQQSSPAVRAVSKIATNPVVPRLRVRKPESPSKYIQTEARKVSCELGKAMEEAFNRSSISSSIRTTATDANREASEYDTPPTSLSNRDSGGSTLATSSTKMILQNRPLPPIPNETPNTFLHRKLAETRAEIARKLQENSDNNEHFNEVLDHLDRLMIPSTNGAKRTSSAPAKSLEHPAALPVISEESKPDGEDRYFESYSPNCRAVTDPVRPQARRAATDHTSVRRVGVSPTRIAPLNIHKRSGASTLSSHADDTPTVAWPGPVSEPRVRSYQNDQNDFLGSRMNENAKFNSMSAAKPNDTNLKKKKSSWFRRTLEEKEWPAETTRKPTLGRLHIPEAWQGLDERIQCDPPTSAGTRIDSEFPMRNSGSASGKNEGSVVRKGLLGLFGKKPKEDKSRRSMDFGCEYNNPCFLRGGRLGTLFHSPRCTFTNIRKQWITITAPHQSSLDMTVDPTTTRLLALDRPICN